MPPIDEIATITVQGRKWQHWSGVAVNRDLSNWAIQAILTATEVGADAPFGWARQRLRIGDRTSVHLAGRLACTGFIMIRQAAATAQPPTHGLQVQIAGRTLDVVRASAPTQPGEYRNQALAAIAQDMVGRIGIPLVMRAGGVAGAPFDRVHVRPGETIAECLERLGRQRGVRFYDTPQGQLVGDDFSRPLPSAGAAIREGGNLISIQALLRNDQLFSQIQAQGQRPGNEQRGTWGDLARAVSAVATNPAMTRYVPRLIAEQATDPIGARERASAENRASIGSMVNVHATVQGWLHGGRLWMEMCGENVEVFAPSVLPDDRMTLAIQAVTHAQDARTGTTTTISLVLPAALQRSGQGLPGVPAQFGGTPGEASENPDQAPPAPNGGAWPQQSDSNWDGAE